MKIRTYQDSDQNAIIQLWIDCGLVAPQNNPIQDIKRKLKVNPEWFLVGLIDDKVMASCMVGYEGHRGWINYLAVSPKEQRQGYATQMMGEAQRILTNANCPKINLQIRTSNLKVVAFYESLGYKEDKVTSLGLRLEVDLPFDRNLS